MKQWWPINRGHHPTSFTARAIHTLENIKRLCHVFPIPLGHKFFTIDWFMRTGTTSDTKNTRAFGHKILRPKRQTRKFNQKLTAMRLSVGGPASLSRKKPTQKLRTELFQGRTPQGNTKN